MCGCCRRKSDKQRIAELFQAEVGLDALPSQSATLLEEPFAVCLGGLGSN